MENRYEANMTEHINLICKGCKKIMENPSLAEIFCKDEIDAKIRLS